MRDRNAAFVAAGDKYVGLAAFAAQISNDPPCRIRVDQSIDRSIDEKRKESDSNRTELARPSICQSKFEIRRGVYQVAEEAAIDN